MHRLSVDIELRPSKSKSKGAAAPSLFREMYRNVRSLFHRLTWLTWLTSQSEIFPAAPTVAAENGGLLASGYAKCVNEELGVHRKGWNVTMETWISHDISKSLP